MTLDEHDRKDGLKFIVGTWEPDFIVSLFSNDLAHIPAKEFKSRDGTDFTALKFEFFQDNTMRFIDTAKGVEEAGTWEQLSWGKFKYNVDRFAEVPDGPFKEAVQELSIMDGNLVFGLGFLSISLKKIADGEVTEVKEPDIGDLEPSEADLAMKDIVGVYRTYKSFAFIDGKVGAFTKEEIEAENAKKIAAGEMDESEAAESLFAFENSIEFTDDHRVIWWEKVPAGVSEEQIKEALDAGEIADYKDGMYTRGTQEWKAVGGKYYYNTEEKRMLFDEVQSPWDELVLAEDGTMALSEGMLIIKKVK